MPTLAVLLLGLGSGIKARLRAFTLSISDDPWLHARTTIVAVRPGERFPSEQRTAVLFVHEPRLVRTEGAFSPTSAISPNPTFFAVPGPLLTTREVNVTTLHGVGFLGVA